MANESQFLIRGNFIVVKDFTTNEEFIREPVSSIKFTRTKDDNFVFFNVTPMISNYDSQQLNVLGRNTIEDVSGLINESRSSFSYADSLDENGVPFVDADSMDQWLSTKLGATIIVNGDGSGYLTYVATDSTLTGDGTVSDPLSVVSRPPSIGNYAQTVQGLTINTLGEQSIVGSGVGSLSIPANGFVIGDSFHGKLGGLINATGGGGRSEIIINVRSNGTILATTGSFDLDNATNQGWEMELDFTIRSIGTAGIISTNGNFVYTKDNNRAVFGYIFQDNKAIDTTVNNTLDVTVEWRVLNSGDDIYSANFVLYKVY